jgi:hypothetical protein
MAKNNLFFYLFNDFIGGADDDEISVKYSKIDLNDTNQRYFFIKNDLKPFYENNFDESQKQEFQILLNSLIEGHEMILKREVNNQLFPFEFPDDTQMLYVDIQKIVFE